MTDKKESILLNHGISNLVSFGNGGRTAANNPYMYMVGDISETNLREVKGIYAFSLPFKTELHLIGIPSGETGKAWLTNNDMEPVILEGNYQTYFSLYAEEGQQSLSRYHLDPQAMVFNIDFCKEFHWEIINNTLYFLDEGLLPSLDIADEFIRLIKPAFPQVTSVGDAKLFVTQVGEELKDFYLKLQCPVCKTELKEGKQWLACPEGHGYLIQGSDMLDVRKDSTHIIKELSEVFGRPPKVISEVTDVKHGELFCPHCERVMRQTRYQMTDVVLDVCSYCPYRWIDGNELDAVLGKYRHESYE